MAERCVVCGGQIGTVFLDKIEGTYMRDRKGKKRAVCAGCQAKHTNEELRAKL